MAGTSYIRLDDDGVSFALDQHAYLYFYSASSQMYNVIVTFLEL